MERPPTLCTGCQFGPTPDFAPDDPLLIPYRSRRYFPGGPALECHSFPGRACAGLLHEMRVRPRTDGDYFDAQTALRAGTCAQCPGREEAVNEPARGVSTKPLV